MSLAKLTLTCLALPVILAGLTHPARAHFPWLTVNDQGKAELYFGEHLADRTYKLPDSLRQAKTYQLLGDQPQAIELQEIDSPQLVGLISQNPIGEATMLVSEMTYGIYHGNRLNYTAMHLRGKIPTQRGQQNFATQPPRLWAELVAREGDATGLDVYLTWQGKPLSNADVHWYDQLGQELAVTATNQNGMCSLTEPAHLAQLRGLMFGHTDDSSSGELDGTAYQASMHYATLTLPSQHPQPGGTPVGTPGKTTEAATKLAPLPFALTSFGAVQMGNSAYVYGGHTGDAHSYSTEEQSDALLELKLDDPQATWQKISTGQRLQGLGMVAYQNQVILIGGFTAKNEPDQEQALFSQAAVRAFDVQTQTWSDLPDLPEPRSSHDATLLDHTIYVVGGWAMAGDQETRWHKTALRLDLSAAEPQWQEIAEPPFQCRALATVAHAGQLYVIGGMDQAGGPTRAVYVFNPHQNTWSRGPDLVGEGAMAGFGAAGCSLGEQLVVSTYEGKILQLDSSGQSWQVLGESQDQRFFHRLLPLQHTQVVSVGGANMQSGKFLDLEVLDVSRP